MRSEDDQGSTTRILRQREGVRGNSAGPVEPENENRVKTRSRTVDGNVVKRILTSGKAPANKPPQMSNSSTDDSFDAAETNAITPKKGISAAAPKKNTIKRGGTKRSRRLRSANDGDDERNALRSPGKRRRTAPCRYSPRPDQVTRQRRVSVSEEDGNVAADNEPQRALPIVTLKPVNFGETFEERQRRRENMKKERNNNIDNAPANNNDGSNTTNGNGAVEAGGSNTDETHPNNQDENKANNGGEASEAKKTSEDIPVITIHDESLEQPLLEENETDMVQNQQQPVDVPITHLIHTQQIVSVPRPTTYQARSKFNSAVATAANSNGYYAAIPYRLPVTRSREKNAQIGNGNGVMPITGRSDGTLPALPKRDAAYTYTSGIHVYNYAENIRTEAAARRMIMRTPRSENAANKVTSYMNTYSAKTARNTLLREGTLRFSLGTQWSLRVSEVCHIGPNFNSALVRHLGPYPEELCTDLLPKVVNDLIRCALLPVDVLNSIESIDPTVPHDTIKLHCQGQLKFRYIPLVKSVSEAKRWLSNFLEMNYCCPQLFIEDAYDCRLCTIKANEKDRNIDAIAVSQKVEEFLARDHQLLTKCLSAKIPEMIRNQNIDYKTLIHMDLQRIKEVFHLQQSDAYIIHSVAYQLRQFMEKNIPESLIIS